MARDERALSVYAERTASLLTNAGFPRMPARVLMTLLVAEGNSLTAHDLSERLEVSAAAISGAVRYLVTLAMVHRVPQSGSRRDLYELPNDSWYAMSLQNIPLYESVITLSRDALLATGGPSDAAEVRISEMAEFFEFLQRRLPELLTEWEELKQR